MARGLTELADSQYEKKPVEADQLFEESISILHSLVLDFPDIPVYQFFLVHAYKEQAETLRQFGRVDEACVAMEKAIDEQTNYLRLRPDNYFGMRYLAGLKKDLEAMRSADTP